MTPEILMSDDEKKHHAADIHRDHIRSHEKAIFYYKLYIDQSKAKIEHHTAELKKITHQVGADDTH